MPECPLVIVPVRAGVLPAGAAEAVAEAAGGGVEPRVVLIGSGTEAAARELAGVTSAVETVEAGEFAVGRWARALAPVAADASFVLLPASPDGRDLGARLAAAAELPLVSGALEVGATLVVVPHHGGRVQSVLHPHGPFVATLQPGVRGVEAGPDEAVVTSALDLAELTSAGDDARVVEVEPPDAVTMDLAEAPRIVGGGAGLMGGADRSVVAERFDRLTAVGEAVGASMGATRVVTDAGFVPHTRQIGTTGVVVDPRLYLAFGISGAVQHTAGLGRPHHIVSVNVDPHCPMMAMADLAVVADASATLDELAGMLGAAPEIAEVSR